MTRAVVKLGCSHPIDPLELMWALESRNAHFQLSDLAAASGRAEEAWLDAMAAQNPAWPSTEVIAERFDVVRQAARDELEIGVVALRARAPRAWCAEVIRRLPELYAPKEPS